METDGIDIDVSRLSATDASELRALFEASAGASRQAGRSAQESFLVGLAALLAEFGAAKVADGEPLPSPVALSTEGAVDLGALTLEDCIRGARLLVQLGELADGRGHEKLGGVIADLALAFTAAARAKVPVGGLPPAAA